LKLSIVILKS